MKYYFGARTPSSFDAAAVHATIEQALKSAGLDTTQGPMQTVTETIRRALAGEQGPEDVHAPGTAAVNDATAPAHEPAMGSRQPPGTFAAREFTNRAGSRAYKLYVPAKPATEPPPVVVMLHGCTQSADDFAAGTRMNQLADEHGFLVLYPEQAVHANASKCWNWFKPQDQQRDAGEPSLIAGMVREVVNQHGADPHRVFVAGLSAGAAMAVVLGEAYPDLFAGVGAHSGLPYGSAHDIPSALAAMKGRHSAAGPSHGMSAAASAPPGKTVHAVPTIVFHGDRDQTVRPANGVQIEQQAQQAHARQATLAGDAAPQVVKDDGIAAGGRRFSRTVHLNHAGQARIESWTLHGAGHAWSGGHPGGSYTDAAGPDASSEMLRFFLALPRAGSV